MKKHLLTAALVAMMASPACAQWVEQADSALLASGANTSTYSYYQAVNNAGYTYVLQLVPVSNAQPQPFLQIVDPQGNLTQGEKGLQLANEENITYVMTNDFLMVDDNGDAIVVVYDYRQGSSPAYTVYKVDQTGDVKWSKTLNEEGSLSGGANFAMVQTSDGAYIFAHSNWSYNDKTPTTIDIYRLNADGTDAWNGVKKLADPEGAESFAYPHLVDAGDGKVMLVYARGSNQDIIARCYNADGTDAWEDEVYVYSGGFVSGVPLQTMLQVHGTSEHGAVVTWVDPDYTSGSYENRINYILPDGTYAMVQGENGVCISNESAYSRYLPSIVYNASEAAFYCIYRQYSQAHQSYLGLNLQKITSDGELLWGENGKVLFDMQDTNIYNYGTVRLADNQEAFFYLWQDNSDGTARSAVHGAMTLYDQEGNEVMAPVEFATSSSLKYSIEVSELIDGKYFIVGWEESPNMNTNTYHMQRVYLNGSVSAITSVSKDEARRLLRQEFYSADGKQQPALTSGMNIVRNVYDNNTVESTKVVR